MLSRCKRFTLSRWCDVGGSYCMSGVQEYGAVKSARKNKKLSKVFQREAEVLKWPRYGDVFLRARKRQKTTEKDRKRQNLTGKDWRRTHRPPGLACSRMTTEVVREVTVDGPAVGAVAGAGGTSLGVTTKEGLVHPSILPSSPCVERRKLPDDITCEGSFTFSPHDQIYWHRHQPVCELRLIAMPKRRTNKHPAWDCTGR